MREKKPIRSEMGFSTPDRIVVSGIDLVEGIIGKVPLGDMAWLEIKGALPTPEQSILFNALMVTMAEHGMTPNAIAARLTYLGAPEAMNAAVAAGLCGLGSVFAGTAEGAARIMQQNLKDTAERDLPRIAEHIVAEFRAARTAIPGLGHPLHKPIDPRTPRLFELARENGYYGDYCELIQLIAGEAERVTGKVLPVNATGAIGAIASELGLDWRICRGIAVMGRAIGLVGHIAEELRNPIAREIWERIDDEVSGSQASAERTKPRPSDKNGG
jgi:citrate synthase